MINFIMLWGLKSKSIIVFRLYMQFSKIKWGLEPPFVMRLRSQNPLTARISWCCKNISDSYNNPTRVELGLPFLAKRITKVDESRTRAR